MGWHDATHVFCWPSPRAVAVLKRDFDLLLFWEIKTKEKDDSFFFPKRFGALHGRAKQDVRATAEGGGG